ncbi:amidohydrolase [Leptospira wolffii]|uniref:Amidohydrolase n=1 Tax=Leptospira wolffii TaxID=409998 RepID=A0A2M9ZGT2_9LEPT|nr:amidohydrolase [Leptospira wolffii]PJZ67639.1 amidohydrolase [Leptospira wolffii]TGK62648.1 amidohydrolase [Leptospira wolffii]TGK65623.1 amidohydrolase [Leptospira wolffii]TGK73965.1 amidohydrolase [Leptospira wolffii]TGL28826.1 amidohydrolase [Leptospira wolffii]
MTSVKITLFQKDLSQPVAPEQRSKLSKEKSDFLLFPLYFPGGGAGTPESLAGKSKALLDEILAVSEVYKGAILGGGMFRRDEEGKLRFSIPIVQNVVLVDWYDVKILSPEDSPAIPGNGDHALILGGFRFGILAGKEIEETTVFEKLKDEKVNLAFHLDSVQESGLEYGQDLKKYADLSAKYGLFLLRSSGYGSPFGKKRIGRSLLSTPTGVTWKVAETEQEKEIIKTVNINGINGLF